MNKRIFHESKPPAFRKSKMRHSSSSCSSIISNSNNDGVAHSVLKLLPAAILTIALVLPIQDREVLAYMITRSINTNTDTKIPISAFTQANTNKKIGIIHQPPLFDCDCFDCYIAYWFTWDSSPNRLLIHRAIDAFEEDGFVVNNNNKQIMGCAGLENNFIFSEDEDRNQLSPEIHDCKGLTAEGSPEKEVSFLEKPADLVYDNGSGDCNELTKSLTLDYEEEKAEEAQLPETAVVWRVGGGGGTHKGLARKVLPDVLGLLNWRFWSLWNLKV